MTAADAPVLDPFGLRVHLGNLVKHQGPGNHPNGSPQSVHGGGGSASPDSGDFDDRYTDYLLAGKSHTEAERLANGGVDYPTGHVVPNPLTISTGDFRMESEPARRFTEFWQRTFEGYDLVRTAAQNVLDGKDPMHEHPFFNLEEDGTWVNGDYTRGDLRTDIESAGRFIADGLRAAKPGKIPLFRGTAMAMADVHRLAGMAKSGETFDLIPSSTSSRLETAMGYANGRVAGVEEQAQRVVFRFPESTERFSLNPYSDWGGDHPEQVVAGRFKVVGVFQNAAAQRGMGYGSKEPEFYVNLEPVEQP